MCTVDIWKDIPGYECYYQVSNTGKVRSVDRTEYGKKFKGKILTPRVTNGGYLGVTLCKCNHHKHISIHRLVAIAFIPNPNNLPQVNHKDENVKNNNVENLEWCTAKYNSNYGKHCEKISKSKIGKLNISAKKVICDGVIYDTLKNWYLDYMNKCLIHVSYNTACQWLSGRKNMPVYLKDIGLGYVKE